MSVNTSTGSKGNYYLENSSKIIISGCSKPISLTRYITFLQLSLSNVYVNVAFIELEEFICQEVTSHLRNVNDNFISFLFSLSS